MKKFEGLMLCSDIDGTLLIDGRIAKEDIAAINYFKSEGGIFTYASGRVPKSMCVVTRGLLANAPVISHNGAAIYDHKLGYIWDRPLGDDVLGIIDSLIELCPYSAVEMYKKDKSIYCYRMNRWRREHMELENFDFSEIDYHKLEFPWLKAIFVQSPDQTPLVREAVLKSGFDHSYNFTQSAPMFIEILSKEAHKGNALSYLAGTLGIEMKNVIAVGDNENDIDMIKMAGKGCAMKNGVPDLINNADLVVSSVSEIIENI